MKENFKPGTSIEWSGAYHNQIRTGDKIIESLKGNIPYVMLLSQMQSGKTSTYLYVACEMIKDGEVNSVIIMTGCREVALQQQCLSDLNKFKDSYLTFYSRVLTGIEHNNLRQGLDRIEVKWGQNLKSTPVPDDPTLIIWEESHFAQSKNNEPYKWFKKHNLCPALQGDFECLRDRRIKVISVSATPFSELINNVLAGKGKSIDNDQAGKVREKLEKKSLVYLEQPEQYRGLKDYREKSKLLPNFSLSSKRGEMGNILYRFREENKYALIRLRKEADSKIILDLAQQHNYLVLQYDMNSKDFNLKQMSTAPEKPTIVLIKDLCRMGCVVPKALISFVFETSRDGKSDACFQGLAGRMCGTPSDQDPFSDNWPEIYIGNKNIERAKTYIKSFTGEAPAIIDHANNVPKQGERQKRQKRGAWNNVGYPTVPILLGKVGQEDEHEEAAVAEIVRAAASSTSVENGKSRSLNKEAVKTFTQWMCGDQPPPSFWAGNTPQQIEGLKERAREINEGKIKQMCIRRYSQKSGHNPDETLLEKGSRNWKEVCDQNNENDKSPLFIYRGPSGRLWLLGWTKEGESLPEVPQDEKLPKTSGNEAFAPGEITTEDGDQHTTNGGQTFHLPLETQTNPTLMLEELKMAVERSKLGNQDESSYQISSQYDHKKKNCVGIYFHEENYGIHQPIGPRGGKGQRTFSPQKFNLEKLELDCGVTFKRGHWVGGKRRKGFHRLTQISWTLNTSS